MDKEPVNWDYIKMELADRAADWMETSLTLEGFEWRALYDLICQTPFVDLPERRELSDE